MWKKAIFIGLFILDLILFYQMLMFIGYMNFVYYMISVIMSTLFTSYYDKKPVLPKDLIQRKKSIFRPILIVLSVIVSSLFMARYAPILSGLLCGSLLSLLLIRLFLPELSYLNYAHEYLKNSFRVKDRNEVDKNG